MSSPATMIKFSQQRQQSQQLQRQQSIVAAKQMESDGHFRMDSVAEPMAKYLTLAASLTSQLGVVGGLKTRASRPPGSPEPIKGDVKQTGETIESVDQDDDDDDGYDPEAQDEIGPLKSSEPVEPPVQQQQPQQQQQQQQQVVAQVCQVSSTPTAAGKGRPLNRVAMNRAKFAIRSYTIAAAGAPKRSRSLVDDARLDTQRNRQLLEEIRREQGQLRASVDVREDDDDETQVVNGLAGKLASGSGEKEAGAPPPQPAEESQQVVDEESEDEAREAERFLSDFPRHISDLDHCNHLLIKYEPELDPTHPGFHDLEYRARRKEVAEVAFNYKHGERIPEIAYDDKERVTWRAIYLRLKEAYAKYACEQHNLAIGQLEQEGVYSPDSIPQLQQVSEFLEKKTGWRLRPVAGLLSARDFLASLAFRVFQTTQYIRHWGNPEHSVEPDCIHELMGHIPMLCDQEFAQFSQELGLASLGASDEQIEKFATLYWFTVEFGLCREQGSGSGELKCYGAGLLSSYGEMEHALESGKPALKEFVPEETAVETYDDSEYQVVYYVARSFQEAKYKIKQYAQAHLERKYELAYDPYTCSIKELSTYDQLDAYANSIKSDMNRLCSALGKLKVEAASSEAATIGQQQVAAN